MLAGNVDSANDIVPGADDDDPGWLDLVDASICGVEHAGDRVEAYVPLDGALQVTLQLVGHGGSISDRVRAGEDNRSGVIGVNALIAAGRCPYS